MTLTRPIGILLAIAVLRVPSLIEGRSLWPVFAIVLAAAVAGTPLFAILGGTAALLFTWINASQPTQPVGYSTFLDNVKTGKVDKVVQEGESYALYGVWGDAAATYAVGSGGTVLRRTGDSWLPEQTPTGATLFGVGRGADGALRAVGEGGVILIKR